MTEKQCENCKFYDEDIDTQPCCSCNNKENFEADNNVGGKIKDKDIIKALECCIKSSHLGECFENKCPLVSEKGCKVGKETLYPYALKLIKNQQAEIEKLKDMVGQNEGVLPKYEQLLKTEAYREFAEKFKEVNLYEFIEEYYDNAELCYEVRKDLFEDFIDKTFKELTERKED